MTAATPNRQRSKWHEGPHMPYSDNAGRAKAMDVKRG
jgi:hypothetical protein